MKVAVLRGAMDIALEEVELARLASDEILLQIAACAICGSDLHTLAEGSAVGSTLGHEYSGVVLEVGSGVTWAAVGDRLAVIPYVACGACQDCASGRANLCADSVGRSGGFSERTIISERSVLFRVPADMDMETAAFLEPTAVAVHAVRRAGHKSGAPAIVMGLGPIGLGIVQVLKADGVSTIVAVDLSPKRRELAERLGATIVIDPAVEDTADQVARLLGSSTQLGYTSSEAQTVFECTGAGSVVAQSVAQLVRRGGRVVVVALSEQPSSFDMNPLVFKEIELVGSIMYTEADWEEAFRLLTEKRVDPSALISHRIPLSRIAEAFSTQRDKAESVKVLVIPDSELEQRS